MFSDKTRSSAGTQTSAPSTTPARPAGLKDNAQVWSRSFSGAAKGIHFHLFVQRAPGGHLHARYTVTPGHKEGWHLEGQIREDDSFVLSGHNGAVFRGQFLPGGHSLTASFHRGTAFSVDQLHLGSPASPPRRPAAPASAAHTETAVATAPTRSSPPHVPPRGDATSATPASSPSSSPVASTAVPEAAPSWQAQRTGMKGFDQHPDVQAAILWGAAQLKVNPNDLAATIGYETGGSFSPAKENEAARRQGIKGAVGLIQFTPSVGIPSLNAYLQTKAGGRRAADLGITATGVSRDSLMQMSPMEQMRFVVLYFNIPVNALPPGATYDKIYQKILAPGRNGDVWYTGGTTNYEKNRQFDANHDQKITRQEAAGVLRDQGMVVNYFVPAEQGASPASRPQPATATAAQPPRPSSARPARQPVAPVPTQTVPEHAEPQMNPAGSFDARVTQALTAFTQAYRFPVTIPGGAPGKDHTVDVQTPYYINSGDIQRAVRAHRASMSAADRAVFQGVSSTARLGKASPEEMRTVAQSLVRLNPFGVQPDRITGAMITGWLKKYGVGVDCSGFVSQALDEATTQAGGKDPHIGDASQRVNRASGSLHGNNREFQKVASPADVRPGDTMWLSGHIRIVVQVGPGPGGQGIRMMIAESTPNTQLPAAHALGITSLLGVDRSVWWFASADRFSRVGLKKKTQSYTWESRPDDRWERPNTLNIEALSFSRYQPLAKARQP